MLTKNQISNLFDLRGSDFTICIHIKEVHASLFFVSVVLFDSLLFVSLMKAFFSAISVFKCIGHIYRVEDEFVASQFLLIDKKHSISVKTEDVVVSAQSHGFIEKIIAINRTSDMVFLETELERCNENTTWAHR